MAKVAIMGYGTVGSYDLVNWEDEYVLDIRDFDDHPEKHLFTKDVNDIINDDEVSV